MSLLTAFINARLTIDGVRRNVTGAPITVPACLLDADPADNMSDGTGTTATSKAWIAADLPPATVEAIRQGGKVEANGKRYTITHVNASIAGTIVLDLASTGGGR